MRCRGTGGNDRTRSCASRCRSLTCRSISTFRKPSRRPSSRITCPQCQCRYALLGGGQFCPATTRARRTQMDVPLSDNRLWVPGEFLNRAAQRALQLDGRLDDGRYLELGAAPGNSFRSVSCTAPIKVGLSLRDSYEVGDTDNRFGFASVGGFLLVPVRSVSTVGQLRVHGGLGVSRLDATTRLFSGGDAPVIHLPRRTLTSTFTDNATPASDVSCREDRANSSAGVS